MGLRFFCVGGGGGSWKMAVALLSVHTTAKNPHPISGMQAYIAYLPGSIFSDVNYRYHDFSEVRSLLAKSCERRCTPPQNSSGIHRGWVLLRLLHAHP